MSRRRAHQGAAGRPGHLPPTLMEIERSLGLVVGQPTVGEALFRALDLKGDLPQALEQYLGLSVTALDLEKFEYLWLKRTLPMESWVLQAPVAGQFAAAGFTNPTTDLLAHVTRVTLTNNSGAAAQYHMGMAGAGIAGLGGTQQPSPRDDRALGASSQMLVQATTLVAAVTVSGRIFDVGPTSSLVLDCDYVVTGQAPLRICCQQANAGFAVTFEWEERALLSSERR